MYRVSKNRLLLLGLAQQRQKSMKNLKLPKIRNYSVLVEEMFLDTQSSMSTRDCILTVLIMRRCSI